MAGALRISIGQCSDKGRKDSNQDFHGALIPTAPLLGLKGIAVALADGISTSAVSHIASESAVKSFLTDYYCTPDSWSVKTAAQRVLTATNSWLHAQNRRSEYRFDQDRGYACTLSALVVKSSTAHLFHVGDSRIYRIAGRALEQLTTDHRVVVSREVSYLGRAMGVGPHLEIDYRELAVEPGDVFLLATDGVYEHVDAEFLITTIGRDADDLDRAARLVVEEALRRGSPDNLTLQILRIDGVPDAEADDLFHRLAELPLPPLLEPRAVFDGYTILRELHASSRSHVYLARDGDALAPVVLKVPSIDRRDDRAYLRRFLLEEWIARRVSGAHIGSAHVLKPPPQTRPRRHLYVVTEYIEGQTLTQWMRDHPRPDLPTVRGIVEQIGKGLQAFHRMEMLHQDLRPDNVMIDGSGTVKIIDFGSTLVPGILDSLPEVDRHTILGTVQYTAPEYFLGEGGSPASDLYALGVITYQMLTGHLPYGTQAANATTRARQHKLIYRPALADDRDVPVWLDGVLRKAVHPDPAKRYQELSEFLYDLRHPRKAFTGRAGLPLIERNPLLFWKTLSTLLALAVLVLLAMRT
ncbi:bifunctional protein-serine/threonine kinase/phosphatase [Azospirillum sp. TSO35-2]|uniref:bifunctional protein-serine/threonine kinase/phosphatase n=1 Tax=Azospirillum sp. TSO35-2 TaxID=716796 RepID=UPI000D61EDD0|nr:bifunctional protein-serine/threonine kinase/phosphatase [Azospirillum sp. TSO35-2]PWC35768.1 protein kinase [Azospirillum sp. TSO35-2]